MASGMTTCKDCGFEWESRYRDCGHDAAKEAAAAQTPLRDGLVDLTDAITLIGTALSFDDSGNKPEDFAWRDFCDEAGAWADKMSALYPELHTDDQFNAACLRLERMTKGKAK
jgi:hypothetical protein